GLRMPDEVFASLARTMQHGRDILTAGLRDAGLPVSCAQGTYFVVADLGALGATDAVDFCWRMPELCGVVGVPVSVFCDDADIARTLVRFAFCKQPQVLTEAATRVASLGSR
ncbi:MAG: aminotransferase, partial [Flexivirga sp.]